MSYVSKVDWKPQGVYDLEDNAWEALQENGRSILVTAGAGAGKTEFLAQKATYLLQTGICKAPKRILAISFKKDAAKNLADRVAKRCPKEQARRFDSMTFDAFTKGLWDRFRFALPEPYNSPRSYRIVMPSSNDYDDFFRKYNINGVTPQYFEKKIHLTDIPICQDDNAVISYALKKYWDDQFCRGNDIYLSFPMINRLTKLLLQRNIYVRKALQRTYPIVFIDEFQDTTYAQYDLLLTTFNTTNTVFTAVGDDKQRIMGWAGAMPDAFDKFKSDFKARHISLFLNWRSHDDLVYIQNKIAQIISDNEENIQAKGKRAINGDASIILKFTNQESEKKYWARWIRHEVDSGCVSAHDIAILVRKRADYVEQELTPVFEAQGLRIRNVDRSVGEIKIQDLLGEDLTELFIPLLRLGATKRNPASWEKILRRLEIIEGIDPSNGFSVRNLQEKLEKFVRQLRGGLMYHPPTSHSVDENINRLFEFLPPDVLQQSISAYHRKSDFERVRTGFITLLKECTERSNSWEEAINEFEGADQIPLMTVHKSKGLEFHTMIFYGLDNKTWRSLMARKPEELNAFFVAFTRAKQRAFFSRCDECGKAISWIEDILHACGVETIDGTSLLDSM